MIFPSGLKSGLAAAVAAVAAASAHAAPTVYFGNDGNANSSFVVGGNAATQSSAFAATLTTSVKETMEGQVLNTFPDDTSPLSVFNNGGLLSQPIPDANHRGGFVQNLTALPGGALSGRFNTTPGAGGVVGPGKWFETDWSFNITLGSLVDSFGFMATDLGDFGGSIEISLFNTVTNTTVAANVFKDANGNALNTAGTNGSLLFFGFTDSAIKFNKIIFNISQGTQPPNLYDTIGFDDFVVGQVRTGGTGVPEPASLALVALSLGLMGALGRHKKQA